MIWLPVVGEYADIDVYASIIAYADLLNQRKKPAKTYIPITPNYSVPKVLRMPEWENKTFRLKPDDTVIILDVSKPELIAKFTPDHQILEIIDHHPGYEEYWHQRIGNKAIIEKIGAVATSIFEWWGECWSYEKMSPKVAKLLLAAILDNTLNFNAKITTDRDREAATKLAEIASTTLQDFANWYFSEVSKTILANLHDSLQDCKMTTLPTDHSNLAFSQLTLWDAKDILSQRDQIVQIMNTQYISWLINVLCISQNKNYIIASSPEITNYFTKLLQLKPEGDWLISSHLLLRKEIMSKMFNSSKS